jgi:hypothetical protein
MRGMAMTDPLEVLNWHESARERSDESFKALRKFDLVERRPAPASLTDTEVLDFVEEYCELVSYVRPTPEYRGGYTLDVDGITTTRGDTLREAACLAAAKFKEINE